MFNVREFLKKAAALLLALMLVFTCEGISVWAAETGTADPSKYNYNTYTCNVTDYSTVIRGSVSDITVDCYCMYVKLPGKTKAIKKINKALKNIVSEFNPEHILGYAEDFAEEGVEDYCQFIYDTLREWVVYNDGKYVSVTVGRNWYAGGTQNIYNDGYTFDLKTGKRANITKVTGWSLDEIKERIIAYVTEAGDALDENFTDLKAMKASDFNFYLKNDNICVVTFPPYSVCGGGYYREYEIDY